MRAFRYVQRRIVPNPKTRYITSTGNMAFNALQCEFTDGGRAFHVWIDDAIAPYVYYTNEKWTSPRWNGKKNPNENWVDRMRNDLSARLAKYLKARSVK